MPSPSKDTRKPKGKGFRVGPRLAKGSYKGHSSFLLWPSPPSLLKLTLPCITADKIKKTLIHKSKVKKQYYKDLAAEGYGAGISSGANSGELGVRKTKKAKPILGEQRRGPVEESEEGVEGEEEGSDAEAEEEEESSSSSEEEDRRRPPPSRPEKGKAKAKPGRPGAPTRSQPPPRSNPTLPAAAPSASAPAKRPRLSETEVEAIRDRKKQDRRDWAQRGARGQPKLGNRVEQLLGKIKRGME